jgi:hypothetical protein
VLHQLGIPRDIYKVELRFGYYNLYCLYNYLSAIMAMSLLRSLISFQQLLKRVDDVTEEAVSFQLFLKRVGDSTEEAWDADGVYVML